MLQYAWSVYATRRTLVDNLYRLNYAADIVWRSLKIAFWEAVLADKQTPESWVGRDVMLARASSTEAELVSLQGISDWGVVCVYRDAEVGEPVLIPWGSVSWLRLAVREEVEVLNGESSEESSG